MATIGDLFFRLLADGSGLESDITRQANAAASKAGAAAGATLGQSMAKGLQQRGGALTAVGTSMSRNLTLPLVGAGAAIHAVGIDFDTTMRQIVALTDVTGDEIGAVRNRVLELATALGRDPNELAQGFYFLASAGFDTAEAMKVLESTAKASAAGLGTTADVSKVVGAAINAFGKENLTAEQATDQLVRAIKDGTAEAPDFANSLGTVLGSAGQMGATFSDTAAAVAGMTLKAISADEATTSLNQVFVSLLKPTAQAEEAMADLGLSSEGLRKQLREEGLLAMLQTLSERFGNNETAAAKVFGNVRALRGILALTGGDAAQVASIFNDVAEGTTNLQTAFEDTEGPGRETDRALAEIKVTLIELSDDVLPVTVRIMKTFASVLHGIADAFDLLPGPVKQGVVGVLALTAALGPLLFITGKVTSGLGSVIGAVARLGKFAFGARIAAPIAESVVAGAVEGVEAVPRNSRFSAGVSKIGQLMGSRLGPLLAAGILLAFDQAARFIGDRITTQYSNLVAEAMKTGNEQGLQNLRTGLLAQRAALPPWSQFLDVGGLKAANDAQLKEVDDALLALKARNEAGGAAAGEALTDTFDRAVTSSFEQDPEWADSFDRQMASWGEHAAATTKGAATEIGKAIPESIADGALENRNAVSVAMDTLTNLMQNLLKRGERIARDIGILTSKQLAEGLTDERDAVRIEAERVYMEAANELEKLIAKGGRVGKKGMEAIRQGLNSENPKVRARFQKLVDEQGIILDKLGPKAYDAGANAGEQFGKGAQDALNSATVSVNFAVVDGKKRHRATGGPTLDDLPYWVNEQTPRSELVVPGRGHVLTHSDAMAAARDAFGGGTRSGGDTIIHMPVSGALPVTTIADISGEMQRIDDSGILPEPRIAPLYKRRLAAGPGARR